MTGSVINECHLTKILLDSHDIPAADPVIEAGSDNLVACSDHHRS
jgi:hypothetical protein